MRRLRLLACLATSGLVAVNPDWFTDVIETPAVQELVRRLGAGGALSVPGVTLPAQPFLAAILHRIFPTRPLVVVTENLKAQEGVQQDLPLLRSAPLPSTAGGGEGARGGAGTAGDAAGAGASAAASQPALDYGYDPGQTFIGTCPECKSDLQYSEGCVKCLACGYSECG